MVFMVFLLGWMLWDMGVIMYENGEIFGLLFIGCGLVRMVFVSDDCFVVGIFVYSM